MMQQKQQYYIIAEHVVIIWCNDDIIANSNDNVNILFQPTCMICGKEFQKGYNMKRHMISVHYKQRFGCQLCGKSFTQMGSLVKHGKDAHGNN